MCNEYEYDESGNLMALYRVTRRKYEQYQRQDRIKVGSSALNPIIRLDVGGDAGGDGERVAELFKWGLIPHWWTKDTKGPSLTWNAVSEKVDTTPMYRAAFSRNQRCLIPATAYLEYPLTRKGLEVRTKVTFKDRLAFAMAGLYDSWTPPNAEPVFTYTMLTTRPNSFVQGNRLHHRMPCVLHPDDYDDWLSPETSLNTLKALMMPCPGEWLEAQPAGQPKKPTADKVRRWKNLMGD